MTKKRRNPNATSNRPSIKVVELFAGVGGFRLGLESVPNSPYKIVWSNQWEPATTTQHASDIYTRRWGRKNHSNKDISKVLTSKIPSHNLLVGGFPCQDYSVARNLGDSHGLIGKKGILWWQIHRILKEKKTRRPSYLILENVDRLLKSPAKQRGRDFAVMLASLSDLGYIVEWRVINAAEYGMPQKRRRVFILAYKKGSKISKQITKEKNPIGWVTSSGILAQAFPVQNEPRLAIAAKPLKGSLSKLSIHFNLETPGDSPFENAGIMIRRKVYSLKAKPNFEGQKILLGHILVDEKEVPEEYFLKRSDMAKWKYLKGAKNEPRQTKAGYKFTYTEGPLPFPDPLDRPARTIITSEGGPNPSRFKHVVRTDSGRFRRLVPVELEKINQFPTNHTKGIPDARRAFMMGNALVVGIIERLGSELANHLETKRRQLALG